MNDTYNTFNFFGADNEETGEVEKMEEKKITKKEFNKAIERVIEKQVEDPKIQQAEMAGFMYTLSGIAFASELRRELFGNSEEQ